MRNNIQTKEESIESVIDGNKTDYDNIYAFAEIWVKNRFKWFCSDDLKDAYYESGGEKPREPKVFGGVFRFLSKNKLIFPFGYTTSRNKAAHGRMLRTWISKEYKAKQAGNASNNNNLKLEL